MRQVAALVALLGVAAGAGAVPFAAAGGNRGGGASLHRTGERTRLTLEVPHCHDCVMQLFQGRESEHFRHPTVWISREKRLSHGEASWNVLRRHTRGMSITVRPPWEGRTGYVTTVAVRHEGALVGQRVSLREARDADSASACWAGTCL